MGGKGSKGPSQAEINQQAYQAGASGAKWNDITGQIPYGHDSALQSWLAGGKNKPAEPEYGGFEFGGFEYPESTGPTYEEQKADQEARYQQQLDDQRRAQGTRDRDSLYGNYLSAASTATDYVGNEISKERSNAALLGIDYAITPDQQTQRVNDYFATIWGEGDHQRLQALMSEWGNPEGFTGFSVVRGDGSAYAGTKASETSVGTSGPIKPPILGDEDEDETLGSTQTVLGV